MRAFEIHTFTGGKWKIDSVFDDRELAVFEAQRIDESSRYAGVRVVEENFDEDTQKTTARTIFRGGRVENDASRRQPPPPPPKRAAGAIAQRGGAAGRARGAKRGSKTERSNSALVIILTVILVGGLTALVALHFLPRFV